jgi:hypothetical protein
MVVGAERSENPRAALGEERASSGRIEGGDEPGRVSRGGSANRLIVEGQDLTVGSLGRRNLLQQRAHSRSDGRHCGRCAPRKRVELAPERGVAIWTVRNLTVGASLSARANAAAKPSVSEEHRTGPGARCRAEDRRVSGEFLATWIGYGTEGQRFESSRARSSSLAGSPVVAGDRRVRCRLGEPRRVTIGVTTAGRA